jgi:drug/metabolite transporter (DMT)-like permease
MGNWLAGNGLLALTAAGLWGVGDFAGGMGVKSGGGTVGAALRLLLLSHSISFCVLLTILWIRGDAFPHGWPLAWGLIAGTAVGVSLTAFYVALSRGAMGASAAISGLLAAAIPAVVAMLVEGAPGWRKGLGFAVAGVAIWMIAAGDSAREQASSMWLATGAGAGFGIYFVALKYAGVAGVIWPMATSRMASLSTCALILLVLRSSGTIGAGEPITRKLMLWVLGTALFDTSGNLLFVAATRAGRLDVASVLGSLYPAATILLAAWVMKERPTRRQGWGMAVAGAAVVLIAG